MNLTYPVNPGIAIFGVNIFRDDRPGPIKSRSQYALDYALKLKPLSVLDVGSGGGSHAKQFLNHGSNVLCIDLGTSVYAQGSTESGLEILHVDFNCFQTERKFDLVWASHILEHQRNVGTFIERLISHCSADGMVCITVPDPHRNLWGGHVSLWTPGLLAYNIVLAGIDLSTAKFVRGTNEFSIFFTPLRIVLPQDLTFDYGDLVKLKAYLPSGVCEDSDPWSVDYAL